MEQPTEHMRQYNELFSRLNNMAHECHTLAKEKGWHDGEETDHQFVARTVPNLHGEASELWEAYRAGNLHALCDKAEEMKRNGMGGLTCLEEELADIIIRVLDASARLRIDIGWAVAVKHAYNKTRPYRHGNKRA